MKLKLAVPILFLTWTGSALAQNPNVIVKLDAVLQYREGRHKPSDVFTYDLMGRYSTVALETTLEPGFDLVVSQRFQQIANDPDDDSFDEAYIEDRGYWRVGKQYIVFGRGQVLRESIYGGSVNMTVGEKAIPITAAYVNSTETGHEGFVGRLGDRIGISGAIGHRFSSNATALTVIRRPEESPGEGHGYKTAVGLDFYARVAPDTFLAFDHVSLRGGETSTDKPMDVTDLVLTYAPQRDRTVAIGLSREWKSDLNFVRVQGQYPVIDGVYLEPFLRFRNGKFFDFAVSLRIKP